MLSSVQIIHNYTRCIRDVLGEKEENRDDGAGLSRQSDLPITHNHFVKLMNTISASQRRMDEKLVQFQVEVRHGQEEAAAKALKRAR